MKLSCLIMGPSFLGATGNPDELIHVEVHDYIVEHFMSNSHWEPVVQSLSYVILMMVT
jgi:hypothetical protein